MLQIRVAIVQLPRMLQDIVASMLATEPDIEVVNAGADDMTLEQVADVVIMGLDHAEHFELLEGLLAAKPSLRIIAVAENGRQTSVYELRPYRTPLGELSATGLVAFVREAGHARERIGQGTWDQSRRSRAGRPS